jgi:hypothetical protein
MKQTMTVKNINLHYNKLSLSGSAPRLDRLTTRFYKRALSQPVFAGEKLLASDTSLSKRNIAFSHGHHNLFIYISGNSNSSNSLPLIPYSSLNPSIRHYSNILTTPKKTLSITDSSVKNPKYNNFDFEQKTSTKTDSSTVKDPFSNLDEFEVDEFLTDSYTIKDLKYSWKSFISDSDYHIIAYNELWHELERFFDFYKKSYPKHKYFAIIFKIIFRNGSVRSCSSTQVADINDIDKLYSIFSQIFASEDFADSVSENHSNIYKNPQDDFPSGKIIFEFKPMISIEGTKYEPLYKNSSQQNFIEGKNYFRPLAFKGVKIPSHMDLSCWPNVEFNESYTFATSFYIHKYKGNEKRIYFIIDIEKDHYNVTVKDINLNTLFTFTDSFIEWTDLFTFKRTIKENNSVRTYFFKSRKVKFFLNKKNLNFIDKISKQGWLSLNSIMTLDLETRTIDGKMVPICMSLYDGKISKTFLFKDHKNWQADMENAFKTLMKRVYRYKKIYVHNFSYFDSIFMIDILSKLGTIKPMIRDNRIIQLNFSFFNKNEKTGKNSKRANTIIFYDSYLLLPASLDSLSKSFNIKNKKSIFPFNFVNEKDFSFDYIGNVPEYKYFPNAFTEKFTLSDYNTYCEPYNNKKWKFVKELSYYCEIDTIALHQILVTFAKEIFILFSIDVTKYPTLPSVAFAIYRSNFMPKNKIPMILSKLHYILKESYYGGITDIYKPLGRNIHSFDVNSLYPSSMKKYPMPVGNPTYFSGNPYFIDNDPFGFFRVKVTAPDLKIPFLPVKVKSKNGQRTICPVGTWTGWYFSEEIKNAEKYGYTFEIYEGFLFEREYIFTEYIDRLYTLKSSLEDNDPKYFISKLLMNALYGRFGMNPIAEENVIVSSEDSEKILMEKKNVKVIPLLSGNVFISYDKTDDEEVHISNISLPISSAIASYSRIQMSHYLYKYRNELYAMDTDGIKVGCKLDPSEIDKKEIGKMKYEYTFKEGVFVAPKVYGGLLEKPYKKYNYELTKVKGLKNKVSYLELKSVLNKYHPLKINQEKWKRDLSQSTIIVDIESYTLSITFCKRVIVFNGWGEVIDTLPIRLKNNVIVSYPFITIYSLPSPSYPSYPLLPAPMKYISLPLYPHLAIIRFIKPQPWTPYIIYVMPLHLIKYSKPELDLILYHIFIIPYFYIIMPLDCIKHSQAQPGSLLIPFIIYIMTLHLIKYTKPELDLILYHIFIIPYFCIIMPLDCIKHSQAQPESLLIPLIIYIIPLHLIKYKRAIVKKLILPYIIYLLPPQKEEDLEKEKDIKSKRGRPRKPKRGRPRKEKDVKPKRGRPRKPKRGRPRKEKDVKPKRGRPRKAKRGRPRKDK